MSLKRYILGWQNLFPYKRKGRSWSWPGEVQLTDGTAYANALVLKTVLSYKTEKSLIAEAKREIEREYDGGKVVGVAMELTGDGVVGLDQRRKEGLGPRDVMKF